MTSRRNTSTMPRVPPDHPVRRRLFQDDEADQARVDNFENILQETAAKNMIESMKKWNFDFKNEVPLEGDIEWTPCDTNGCTWVGKEKEEPKTMQVDNEKTPKTETNRRPPVVKKRSIDSGSADKDAKRKISFD